MPNEITITREAYTALVKEAHDSVCLKGLIANKRNNYGSLSHEEIKTLFSLYFEEKGEGEE